MSTRKEELYSKKIRAGSRIYFFDVKESENGAKYLVIDESRKIDDKYEHKRVMVFEENIFDFYEGVYDALKFLVLNNQPKS